MAVQEPGVGPRTARGAFSTRRLYCAVQAERRGFSCVLGNGMNSSMSPGTVSKPQPT